MFLERAKSSPKGFGSSPFFTYLAPKTTMASFIQPNIIVIALEFSF